MLGDRTASTAWPRPRRSPDPAALDAPVIAPSGRGKALAEGFAELGIRTLGDALESPPFRFEDLSDVSGFDDLAVGGMATVVGSVRSVRERPTRRRGLVLIAAVLEDAAGRSLSVSWFNLRYLLRALKPGARLLVRGEVRSSSWGLELSARSHEILAAPGEWEEGSPLPSGFLPVYHASTRVPARQVREAADRGLALLDRMADPLPPDLRARRGLALRADAIAGMHRPRRGDRKLGRRRLAYEELLLLQIELLRHRQERRAAVRAEALPAAGPLYDRYLASLPFELTAAQRRVLAEIDASVAQTFPMRRLLQGDVGAGKTAVALGALLRAVDAGRQGALMAPTETLAQQHLRTAERLLADVGLELWYLAGEVPARERRIREARIASGEPGIAVGTHALLNAAFPALAVTVVDEQHRFGVGQRQAVGGDLAFASHVLHMTATPIPRSLALTAFGDLDVSVLDELPAGRRPIATSVIPEDRREDCYRWLVGLIGEGRQAYVVCPLVEDSDTIVARAAEAEAERLAAGPLASVSVGCMHGQLPAGERAAVMSRFVRGELDVLVATTVIEVGVDVANATVMIVEDADRFGLAQLHQLRGRVGRGTEQSHCLLFASAEPTEDGRRRLEALVRTTSGFALAEVDLALRGEGRLLGVAQSGRSDLRFARLARDRTLLTWAREDAGDALETGLDPVLGEAARKRFGAIIEGLTRA
jgi:ATP-dependent DNA helicase RecG